MSVMMSGEGEDRREVQRSSSLSDEESSGGGFSSEESDEEDEVGDGNAGVMALFASYYGIEGEAQEDGAGDSAIGDPSHGTTPSMNSPRNGRSTAPISSAAAAKNIDEPGFVPTTYVRELLLNKSIEELVAKDGELIHGIRALDGEMQKLVYDNYNKFITATESIREMKTDVYAMDADMEAVRHRMAAIAQSSSALDAIVDEKRTQVDKLVRVRRLLDRLEFLSELPERLAAMIDARRYREAVELYNKTISVLTQHAHVLSLKNIKERTQLMMSDLTERVMELLDDATLDASMITQYVGILRLMRAPRYKVLVKLLNAHKMRCARLAAQFFSAVTMQSSVEATAVAVNGSTAAGHKQLLDNLQEISNARQYHQSVLVSLLEIVKAVGELYSASTVGPTDSTATLSGALSTPLEGAGPSSEEVVKEVTDVMTAILKEYSGRFLASFKNFLRRFHATMSTERIEYVLLSAQEMSTMEKKLLEELLHLPINSDANTRSTGDSESKNTEVASTRTDVNPQFELQEERASWLLLTRQAIMDVMYLDSTLHEVLHRVFPSVTVVINSSDSEVPSVGDSSVVIASFADGFSRVVLTEVNAHVTTMRSQVVSDFLHNWSEFWIPRFQYLASAPLPSTGSAVATHGLGSGVGTPASISLAEAHKSALSSRLSLMNAAYNSLLEQTLETFTQCSRYVKPLMDIHEAQGRDTAAVCVNSVRAFVESLTYNVYKTCGLQLTSVGDNLLHTARHSQYRSSMSPELLDPDLEIYTTPALITLPTNETSGNANSGSELMLAALMRKLVEELPDKLEYALMSPDWPSLSGRIVDGLKIDVSARLEVTAFVLLNDFVNHQLKQATECGETILYNALSATGSAQDDDTPSIVSDDLTGWACSLEKLVWQASLMFGEVPYAASASQRAVSSSTYANSHSTDSSAANKRNSAGGRRGSLVSSTSSGAASSTAALQMDIEKLFSNKITIIEPLSLHTNVENIIVSIFKSLLKSLSEILRLQSLSTHAYGQLTTNLLFLRQLASALVKDATELETLSDQVLDTAHGRSVNLAELLGGNSRLDTAKQTRAVSDAMTVVMEKSILFVKTNVR